MKTKIILVWVCVFTVVFSVQAETRLAAASNDMAEMQAKVDAIDRSTERLIVGMGIMHSYLQTRNTECIVKVEATPEIEYTEPEDYIVTAYCPCRECSGEWGNRTATGVTAVQGRTIAVDPKVIPYGSHVLVDGVEYIAEDCGGSIKGKHIDIYFDDHQVADDFGIQTMKVQVEK